MIDVLTADAGLVLRTWRSSDLEPMTQLLTDPESLRWSPPVHPTGKDWIAERLARLVRSAADDDPTSFVIAPADDVATVLGSIDLRRDLPIPPFSVVDVGYSVLPSARGHHVAGRALRLLSTWVLSADGMDVERVQLDHAVENVASCRTADHAGFTHEGIRSRFLPLQDSPSSPVIFHDTCLHGLVR